jgi:hypothetical protein
VVGLLIKVSKYSSKSLRKVLQLNSAVAFGLSVYDVNGTVVAVRQIVLE